MRAHEAAVAALDAGIRVPDRHQLGDVALLVGRRAARVGAVDRERADREVIAPTGQHLAGDGADELGRVGGHGGGALAACRHRLGDLDAVHSFHGTVDRRLVALDDLGAAPAVRLVDGSLDPLDRLLARQHARDREEARLQDDVGPAREADLAGDPARVDRVQLDPLCDDLLLHRAGQRVPHPVGRVRAVQEQCRAVCRAAEDVDPVEHPELVAADEARPLHEVGRPDRPWPETKVRDRLRSRLLRVVDEVALGEQTFLRAEDLDRVLVRADGSVRAQSEEDRAHRVRWLDIHRRVIREARPGDVVVDADREPASWPRCRKLVEHPGDHAGCELLRRQAVAPADDPWHRRPLAVLVRLGQRRDRVEEERLAQRARLLGAVEHGDVARRSQAAPRRVPARETACTAEPAARRLALRARSASRPSPGSSRRPIPSRRSPARPPGARCTRRCACGGRCARRAGPSHPRRRPARGRRTG